MKIDLSGVFVPCTTPFDLVSGGVDLVGLRANLTSFLSERIRGVVVGGSTGEAVLLEEGERERMLEEVRDLVSPDRLVVAGTGAESTRGTIRRCEVAARTGADAVLVQPPAFYKGAMTARALFEHYRAVAAGSTIPVILYQVPLRMSTLEFTTSLVEDLSRIENVVGIKDSRGNLDLVGELVVRTPDEFQVLVGSGAILYEALELGVTGGILAVANLAPGLSAGLYSAFLKGNSGEAVRMQEVLAAMHTEIVGGFGVPGVKVALDLLGLRGGDPRPPLRSLSDVDREKVSEVLAAAGFPVPVFSSS